MRQGRCARARSNYRYGALERLNLGRDALRARFPKLVGESPPSTAQCA